MSQNTVPRNKMNIRSPFYIDVDDSGKPESIGDSSDTPTVPDEYTQPATAERIVACGGVQSITEDVGVVTYKLDTGDRVGDVSIDYAIFAKPIKITANWDGNAATTNYVGTNLYDTELTDAGVPSGQIATAYASTSTTGTLTINKSSASPSEVTVVVTAPLPTDFYTLTFNCPAETQAPTTSLPSPVPSTPDIFENIPVIHMSNAYDYDIYVNDDLVQSVRGASPAVAQNSVIVLSNETTAAYVNGFNFYAYTPPNEAGLLVRYLDSAVNWKAGDNKIRIYNRSSFSGGKIPMGAFFERSGFFYDVGDSRFELAGANTDHPRSFTGQNSYHVMSAGGSLAGHRLLKEGWMEVKWNGTQKHFLWSLIAKNNPSFPQRDYTQFLSTIA